MLEFSIYKRLLVVVQTSSSIALLVLRSSIVTFADTNNRKTIGFRKIACLDTVSALSMLQVSKFIHFHVLNVPLVDREDASGLLAAYLVLP